MCLSLRKLFLHFQHEIVKMKKENNEFRRSMNEAVGALTDDREITGKYFTNVQNSFVQIGTPNQSRAFLYSTIISKENIK